MKYIMVESSSSQEFVKVCNAVIRAGGETRGGVSVCKGTPNHPLNMTYCQAFLLPEDVNDEKLTEAINS